MRTRGIWEESKGVELATAKQRKACISLALNRFQRTYPRNRISGALDLLISFSKTGDKEFVTKIVEELNQRWTKKENQQRKK